MNTFSSGDLGSNGEQILVLQPAKNWKQKWWLQFKENSIAGNFEVNFS